MIDNFLGIDTDVGIDRSSLQYFITQGMGQSSMFLTFHTICNFRGRTSALGRVGGGKGGIPGRLHSCLL